MSLLAGINGLPRKDHLDMDFYQYSPFKQPRIASNMLEGISVNPLEICFW